MKNIFIIIIIISLFSCRKTIEKEYIKKSDFKQIVNLSIDSANVYTKVDIFARAPYLYKADNLLIAHDIFSTSKGIHFFKNKKYLKSVGRIGRGNNEIIRPGPLFIDKKNQYLWIADWGRNSFTRYSLDSLLQTDNFIGKRFNFEKTISYEIKAVTDTSILCMTQYEPPYLYRILSEQGRKGIAKIKDILPEVQELEYPRYMTTYSFDPKAQKIYMAFRNIDAMMCIDTSGNVLFKRKFFDQIGFKKKVTKNRDNEISTFSFLKIFDNKIFVLYSGYKYIEGGNIGQPTPNFPDKLLVFDLKGNPLSFIKFDGEIFDYVYDSDNEELIVYSLSSEIYPLIYYNIKL